MKILCVSPWKNTWVDYWTKFLESRGHEVKWHIDQNLGMSRERLMESLWWSDVVLCMWADKYATELSQIDLKGRRLYVILRSYEVFSADGWANIPQIKWDNVYQLFMINETFVRVTLNRIAQSTSKKQFEVILFQNGIDMDEWQYVPDEQKDDNKVAWICNINEKKGIELCVQAMHVLGKEINQGIVLEHIGINQDLRRWFYLESIMPRLNVAWMNSGFTNSHKFVQRFLKDKKYLISSSILEGHPMNVIEAMAMGTKPLIHHYPGAETQFPKELLWSTFDDLKKVIQNDFNGQKCRAFAEEHFDYRKTYLPVVEKMEKDNG